MASITRATRNLAVSRYQNVARVTLASSSNQNAAGGLQRQLMLMSNVHVPPSRLCPLPTNPHIIMPTARYMSTSSAAEEAYWTQKNEEKRIRAERFKEREAHKEKVKLRRVGKPKNTRKKAFESWFLPKKKMELRSKSQCQKQGLSWEMQVAVVLERLPVVLPDKPQWEKDYDNLRTYLDQFGRDYPEALFGKQEIEELEDLSDEAYLERYLPRGFTPAPRETEADHSGDVRTLDRRLKNRVYLTVKDSMWTPEGEKELWQFPTVRVQDEEVLLDAAKRAIREKVGDGLDIWYPSNCPMAVDVQVLEKEEQSQHGGAYGIKTFFMVVQYDEGKVTKKELNALDFAWLEKSEVVDRIKEEQGEQQSKLYNYLLAP